MLPYADQNYYYNKYNGEQQAIKKYLELASEDIDTLTYNRIIYCGFDNLTNFQKEKIQRATCMLADFKIENEELLQTPFSSYSINGVAMSFDNSFNIKVIRGIAIPLNVYRLLNQTGLMNRNVRY
ncbi:MAG: hypothetical protein SOZ71_04550 [Clostridium sp.]|nr:hypothetical protein [Clostridium sp.]